jgi:hypothetical protein
MTIPGENTVCLIEKENPAGEGGELPCTNVPVLT